MVSQVLARQPIRISRAESHISTILVPIRLGEDGHEILQSTQATGFFWESQGKWFLVTNLHAITGWHYERERSLSPTGFAPTHIEFQISVNVQATNSLDQFAMKRIGKRISLEEDGQPIWLQHPTLRDSVDVAVIPLFDTPSQDDLTALGASGMITFPANRHGDWTSFDLAAADDAYILGFPKGMSGRGFPIWKRASIATEPDIDLDGLPKMLVDTATREGMSGSPVIAIRRGLTMPSGKFDGDSIIGESMSFAGIYSGRVGDDELGVQLGIVWKARVVEEIIVGGERGRWPWDR